jgi:hypothetical protein
MSNDMKIKTAAIEPPKRDTPGGPITGNRVAPSPWQNPAQGGPMLMAGDTKLAQLRSNTLSRSAGQDTHLSQLMLQTERRLNTHVLGTLTQGEQVTVPERLPSGPLQQLGGP